MELYHHGIKGQKWGIRRFQNKNGSLTSAGKKRYEFGLKRNNKEANKIEEHEDYVKAHTRKSVKEMSDQELRERINRLNMEQQYANLSNKRRNEGIKFVESILRENAKEVAKEYTRPYMKKGIEHLLSKASKVIKKG